MTVKVIEELWCDRCDTKFERGNAYGAIHTMEIGWFKYRNGGGSKETSPGRTWENLDKDLCDSCTEAFFEWWNQH